MLIPEARELSHHVAFVVQYVSQYFVHSFLSKHPFLVELYLHQPSIREIVDFHEASQLNPWLPEDNIVRSDSHFIPLQMFVVLIQHQIGFSNRQHIKCYSFELSFQPLLTPQGEAIPLCMNSSDRRVVRHLF